MKNFKTKAFTLVEMLIVIVIIGILIAALLPRLQGAQSMARDTSRQTALSQIGAGILAYQSQFGHYPLYDSGAVSTEILRTPLVGNGLMNDIPTDRSSTNSVSGLGSGSTVITGGNFAYMVITKNSMPNNGYVIMAHTETPGNSNWVVASGASTLADGLISATDDLRNVIPCSTMTQGGSSAADVTNTSGACIYYDQSNLRYIYTY